MNPTRRKILLALAGASTLPSLTTMAYTDSLSGVAKVAREVQSTLQLCCPNLGDAEKLGELYLKQQPTEATVAVLQSKLWSDIDVNAANLAINRAQQVLQKHLRDCAETRMITVDGIMLSRTEARMYGLGYLLS